MRATTIPYVVDKHLQTYEQMAAYLEVCIEDADGDTSFIAKARATSHEPRARPRWSETLAFPGRSSTSHCLASAAQAMALS